MVTPELKTEEPTRVVPGPLGFTQGGWHWDRPGGSSLLDHILQPRRKSFTKFGVRVLVTPRAN